jgi:hypothetical protein
MPTTTPYPAPSGRTGAIEFVAMLDDDLANLDADIFQLEAELGDHWLL